MGVLDASRFRPRHVLEAVRGFSTQVRNGTCCRKAIRTTKLCIGAFKLGAAEIQFKPRGCQCSASHVTYLWISSSVQCAFIYFENAMLQTREHWRLS